MRLPGLIVLIVGLGTMVLAGVLSGLRWRRGSAGPGVWLRLAAVAATVLTSLMLTPWVIEDSREDRMAGVAIVLVPPTVIAALTALTTLLPSSGGLAAGITWGLAVLMFAYVPVYGLGVGLYFLPANGVLFAAAAVLPAKQPDHRHQTEAHGPDTR